MHFRFNILLSKGKRKIEVETFSSSHKVKAGLINYCSFFLLMGIEYKSRRWHYICVPYSPSNNSYK